MNNHLLPFFLLLLTFNNFDHHKRLAFVGSIEYKSVLHENA